MRKTRNNFFFFCGGKKKRKRKKYKFILTAHLPWIHPQFYLKGENLMLFLPDDKKMPLAASWKTKKGSPAKVDPSVPEVWTSFTPDICKIEIDPVDGVLKAFGGTLIGGEPVVVQCEVKADADLGEGMKEVKGLFEITVIPGEAAMAEVAGGALEDQ